MPHLLTMQPSEVDESLLEGPHYRAVLGGDGLGDVAVAVHVAEWLDDGHHPRRVLVQLDVNDTPLELEPHQAQDAAEQLRRLADQVARAGNEAARLLAQRTPQK